MGKTVGYDGQEKEWQIDDERVPPNCNAPDDVPPSFKISCSGRLCAPDVARKIVTSLVVRLTRWFSACDAWWNKLRSGKYQFFVMDCDVAAAFDHVSHHVIIDAMEALKVHPV